MKRATIVLNDKVFTKLREVQAKKLKRSTKAVSLSAVINQILAGALKVKMD